MDDRARSHYQNRRAGAVSESVFVTGHRGLLGSALVRALAGREVITAERGELDLRDAGAVEKFVARRRPSAIIHAAARNGGLMLHEAEPAAMLLDNLAIATGVIRAALEQRISRLIYVSSACVYSGGGEMPQKEVSAATVIPGGITAGYAFAKIAGIQVCEAVRRDFYEDDYCSIIPCNLYGPGDNYHRDHATVVPGMMRRMHDSAKAHLDVFKVWGSGRQTRELLHGDDLAAACLLLLDMDGELPARVNCSPEMGTSMFELAAHLKAITGFRGEIVADPLKPEGQPRPVLDCTLLRSLGWSPRIELADGLRSTYGAFLTALADGTLRGG
jgi:GDP-L-fucose synthase